MPAVRLSETGSTEGRLKGLVLDLKTSAETRSQASVTSHAQVKLIDVREGNVVWHRVDSFYTMFTYQEVNDRTQEEIYYPRSKVERELYRTTKGKV
jgi:hypothetical protein